MKQSIYLLLGLCLILICSCQSKDQSSTPAADTDSSSTTSEEIQDIETYTIMTQEQAQFLFDHAEKVDVLFTNLAISLSQVKKSDVKGQISFLKKGEVPINHGCAESANIIFQSETDIIADGRMYLEGDCRYVVFYEENKPAYAAYMTDQGMKFYRQILSATTSTVKE